MIETQGGVNKSERGEGSRRRSTDSQRCDQTIGQTFMLIDSIFLESPRPERSTWASERWGGGRTVWERDGRVSGGQARSPVTYSTADVYIQSSLEWRRGRGVYSQKKETPFLTTGKGSTRSAAWRRSRSVTIAKHGAANSSTIWYIIRGLQMSPCVLYDD
ncbi:hypothetical protein ROHU_025869 [Labeo rohita]|uniref:Uncharacterized protein n=1 Tax=Labeo rohita TaxID=84645 RepID=A0A498MHK4_LABRO|nr:hypothetical protein ROHU_025869 [Labeo rohita]